MRFRVVLALSLSIILVGLAFWVRNSSSSEDKNSLVAVSSPQNTDSSKEFIKNYLIENAGSIATSSQPSLSSTDLISRQMFADYLALSTNGQATDANIEALAERYVANIPSLFVPEKVSYQDLQIVANNKANLQTYGQNLTQIYTEYATKLLATKSSSTSNPLGTNSSQTYLKMSEIYHETALKLKAIPTPALLADSHLELINLYLENASATKSLANLQTDPASGFSGLLALGNNVDREEALLLKIAQILTANGI